eukprot:1669279-Amphidinium_carterae.1
MKVSQDVRTELIGLAYFQYLRLLCVLAKSCCRDAAIADWSNAGPETSHGMEAAPHESLGMEPLCESYGCATGYNTGRWRMVLYHDRSVWVSAKSSVYA